MRKFSSAEAVAVLHSDIFSENCKDPLTHLISLWIFFTDIALAFLNDLEVYIIDLAL